MFNWLPEIVPVLNAEFRYFYWLFIVPFTLFCIFLEMIKTGNADILKIVKRLLFSIILLVTFDDCFNVIAMIGDGITDKIGGNLQAEVWKQVSDQVNNTEMSVLKWKQALIMGLSILSYLAAGIGYFLTEAMIHFVFAILYIVSPLMILMYIMEEAAGITKNLYLGLMRVCLWKVLWSILVIMLYKYSRTYFLEGHEANSYNMFLIICVNLCIGVCMLLIPVAVKSIFQDGFTSMASGLASIPSMMALGYGKSFIKTGVKNTKDLSVNAVKWGSRNLVPSENVQNKKLQPKDLKESALQKTRSAHRAWSKYHMESSKMKNLGENRE